MMMSGRLLAVAEALRQEADDIHTSPGKVCQTCDRTTYTDDETARFKLKRNLGEVAERLEKLAGSASKIGLR